MTPTEATPATEPQAGTPSRGTRKPGRSDPSPLAISYWPWGPSIQIGLATAANEMTLRWI
jgi:hypothetical protein